MRTHAPRRTVVFLTVTIASVFLMSGIAQAALVKLSVARMTRLSRTIVVGRVFSTTPRYVPAEEGAGRPTIETVVRVRVEDALKGKPGRWVTVRVPGGTIGGETLVVEEVPQFSPGETCFVFLDTRGRVVGWQQGKFRVVDGRVPRLGLPVNAAAARISALTGSQRPGPSAGGRLVSVGPVVRPLPPLSPTAGSGGDPDVENSVTTSLSDGFESGFSWTTYLWAGTTNWARSTAQASAGTYSAYCAAGGSPTGPPAPNGMDNLMYRGPYDLTGCDNAYLDFDVWLNATTPDALYYLVTYQGASYWYGSGWTGSTGGWTHQRIDLSAVPDGDGGFVDFVGRTGVSVGFGFSSDASTQSTGAYIDQVALTREITDPPPTGTPTITTISPGTASAGTNTPVTITWTDFGGTQGSGKVEFFYKAAASKIPATVTSWTDTQIVCTVPVGLVDGYNGSAGSGPVTVTNGGGLTSAESAFSVTFGYGQRRWQGTGTTYRVNPNTADTAGEEALFDAGATTWNPPSNFFFTDGGTCGTTAVTANLVCEVFWTTGVLPAGVLAQASTWTSGGNVVETDINFNDQYLWGDGSGSSYDIQSIATHELGHTLSLRDLYGPPDSGKVMYGFGGSGPSGVKRSLHADDTAGIVWIYGARPAMSGTMRVNSDVAWTNSPAVTLNSSIGNALQMRFSNDDASWSGWEAYAATKGGWSLTAGDGSKTVYGQYKDAGGNVYAQTDTIVLDATAPVTTDNHDGGSYARFTLALSPSDASSGVVATQYRIDGGVWVSGTGVTLCKLIRNKRAGLTSGAHTVDYRSTDNAGNVEALKSCVVTLS